jgi:Mg-chelatase subunit ChlD
LTELHGFKLLGDIKESDYDNILNIGGMTALLDAVDEGIQTTSAYAKQLTANNFFVNAIVVVVTDGQNNAGSIYDAAQIKKSLEEARKSENLESITLILVGVTSDDNNLDAYLQKLVTDAGISQYTSIGKATPGKIAKLAAFVSQSISSTSAALGSGQPSIPINMTF